MTGYWAITLVGVPALAVLVAAARVVLLARRVQRDVRRLEERS